MESFCATRKEGRVTENRGRKVRRAALKERVERSPSPQKAHEGEGFPAEESGQDVPPGISGKWLRSALFRASAKRLAK